MQINKIHTYLLFGALAISGLCANADEPFDSVNCTTNDGSIKVSWVINWTPTEKKPNLEAKVTANDGVGKPFEVMATNVVMEKIQHTNKFRVTRLIKATSTNHRMKPLNIKAYDNKKKYLSVTYIGPVSEGKQEIWKLNGYINKVLYTDKDLSCDIVKIRTVNAPAENSEEKKGSQEGDNQFALEALSVNIDNWFKTHSSFIGNNRGHFQLVWIAPTAKFFTEGNEVQFAFKGILMLSKTSYEDAQGKTRWKERKYYAATPALDYNVNYLKGDGNEYYLGSYMTSDRVKNGVPISAAIPREMEEMQPVVIHSGTSVSHESQ
jgi:hypothetical protein